jgi:hypothetical protein
VKVQVKEKLTAEINSSKALRGITLLQAEGYRVIVDHPWRTDDYTNEEQHGNEEGRVISRGGERSRWIDG